jgi:small subunit ribosomal protein S3Ae
MAKISVKSKVKKVKRKFPVEIVAPEFLNSKKIGSSNVTDLNTLVGKTVKQSMMYVTGSVKNQNVRLTFKVSEVNSGLAKTQLSMYQQIPYYLGRHVKANSNLIEDSFVVKSKDGLNVRIKPFIVTKQAASGLVKSVIRTETIKVIANELAAKTYDEFMNEVIGGKIQIGFRNTLKVILPLKAFEFKKISLE